MMMYIVAGILILTGLTVALFRSFRKSVSQLYREVNEPRDDAADELERLARNMENMLWGIRKPLPAMSRSRLTEKKRIGSLDSVLVFMCGLCIGIALLFYGGGIRPASGGGGFVNAWTIAGAVLILAAAVLGVCNDDTRRIAGYSACAEARVELLERLGRISEALDEQTELMRIFPDWEQGRLVHARLLAKLQHDALVADGAISAEKRI